MPLENLRGRIIYSPPAVQHHAVPVPHRREVESAWAQLISSLDPAQREDLDPALETLRRVLRS